ncbi:MAG: Lrp/AsnC family transcriptional regulator [Candidatus Diapherotrites archaeon]|nr:Lrp/AsnC family transcriptional regulator [Candidatus Diapherotrites archaeon]MDZ4256526.1 Lrp/AsnC family transcriptional regulator [archaeon]
MALDNHDKDILNAVRWKAKAPLQQIAKKLHLPLSTVHHRIKRFEDQAIITRYEARVDYSKLDRPIQAFVLIEAQNTLPSGEKVLQQDILKHVKEFAAVEEAFVITGGADLMLRVRVKDLEELNDLITVKLRKLDGVGSTQTMMVLKESGHHPGL